ncbi:NAD(P)H-binding protein [Antrihabitans sp. YC2-6]|nr:NAD(P)-binding oxidoreductase [Antrihabitans sp. YC2-6]MBJ8344067.1 NAD(P)H-binding protein [Antrihabitans sp. YC2-6]
MTAPCVVIAGGHGQIARHMIELCADRGIDAVALIRNPAHTDEVTAWGARPLVLDLEQASESEVADALSGATAIVFAAGAGPGSGAARKDTVDRGAAVLLAAAAESAGVRRFVQISSFGAGEAVPASADENWAAYIAAKTAAEVDLRARDGLDWTILRPGRLTDDDPSGLVTLSAGQIPKGDVSRADVAAVIIALLDSPGTKGTTLMLTAGDSSIAEAVKAL